MKDKVDLKRRRLIKKGFMGMLALPFIKFLVPYFLNTPSKENTNIYDKNGNIVISIRN